MTELKSASTVTAGGMNNNTLWCESIRDDPIVQLSRVLACILTITSVCLVPVSIMPCVCEIIYNLSGVSNLFEMESYVLACH